jgi:outer membrane receptor for ferrienterochelin and colicins
MTIGGAFKNVAAAEAEIEETVVTATRTAVSLKDAPGAITVITAEDIKDMNANDILDIIRESAGISLIGRGVGGRNVISIRGLNSWHSLIMIDGKRISASDAAFGHSDFEQNWVPLENIERIEVVRGPLSALYGSEAMGGVINIITKKTTAKWRGSVKVGGGAIDSGDGGENQNYAMQVGGPLVKEKLGLSISAEYIKDEDTPDEDTPKYSELEGKEVFSVGGKLTFMPTNNHTLEAAVNVTTDDRWRDTATRGRPYEGLFELDKTQFSLSWRGTIGPTRSTITAYRSDFDKNSIKNYASGRTDDYPEQLTDNVLDAQTSFSIGSNLITLGGEIRNEELESTTMLEEKDDVTYTAFFIQDELALFSDRLLLTPGVRWDDHEAFGSEVSPRLYALYKITDQINLKAGYGHAFRAPTIKQVSEGYHAAFGPHEFVGNPDVQPETSDSYEIGVEYFADKIFARCLFFYNDINDLIDWKMVGRSGRVRTFTADNVAEAETKGLETEVGVDLPFGLGLSGSYTYLDAKDTGNDERLDQKPRHTANAKLKYSWDAMGLSAALRVQYIADQVLWNDDDELESAPDYALWHFSIRKAFLKYFEVQAGVENIGDVRLADKSDLFGYEERGRFYYANLRVNF